MELRTFDQLFRDLDRLSRSTRVASGVLPMDVVRRDDGVQLYIDVPGVDPESIDLTAEQDHLTITVERKSDLGDDDSVVASERATGTATRRVFLARELDADGISADVRRGVLIVTVPFVESARPRKITVGDTMELTGSAS